MLLVVDGPEKAGKTTFCRHLADTYGFSYVKWGPIPESLTIPHPTPEFRERGRALGVPGDYLYTQKLSTELEALTHGVDVVWDRSWASETVYSRLLGRNRHLDDAWLGEWLHGRAVSTVGQRLMLLGPSSDALHRGRDDTDLPVDPAKERAYFNQYGVEMGWRVFQNQHQSGYVEGLANVVVRELRMVERGLQANAGCVPPYYVGPVGAGVVFIGEERNANDPWLWPFCTPHPTQYGRLLGGDAFRCGWTNAADVDKVADAIRGATLVVACGEVATRTCRGLRGANWSTLAVPHPAALYRWGRFTDKKRQEVEESIRSAVADALNPTYKKEISIGSSNS